MSRRAWVSTLLVATLVSATTGAIVCVASALAAPTPNATVQQTIYVAVRSVTVSPNSVSMCSADAPLTFPNGDCYLPLGSGITITNGGVGGHIDVQGASAQPADGGQDWTLCGGVVPCTGNGSPGVDQFTEFGQGTKPFIGGGDVTFTTSPQCDMAFDNSPYGVGSPGCMTTPGQEAVEYTDLVGPSSSTDQSQSFTTSVTWMAVP
jgi:hypothetical protein